MCIYKKSRLQVYNMHMMYRYYTSIFYYSLSYVIRSDFLRRYYIEFIV